MGLSKQERLMIVVLMAGTLLVVLNQTLLSPALPSIMADLNVNATTVQWLTSGYAMVEAIIIPLNAFFIGRFPTRRLFIIGISWFAFGSLVAALAPNFYVLLLGRIMQAMATGVVMPMTFTLILLIFPREKRGSAMGIVGLVISFAPAVGPSVSGVLVDSVGWRFLFIIIVAIAVLVVIFSTFSLKNYGSFERAPLDFPSVVLLLLGMFGLLYGLSTFTSSALPLVSAAMMIAGIILLALFARRQLRLEQPILRVDVFKARKFRTVVIAIALLQAALVGSGVIFPIFVQNVLGESATVSGLILLPGAVLGAFVGLWAGRFFDAHGVRGLAICGALVLLASAVALVMFHLDTSILIVCLVYTVMSMGIQLLITPMNTWGINSLDNKLIQHGNALSSTMNQVGASFGTALIVSLTGLAGLFTSSADPIVMTFTGTHVAFIGMMVLLALVAVIIFLFVREVPGKDVKPSLVEREFTGVAGVDRPFYVADVMDAQPGFVPEGASVRDVIKIMRKRNTSGVPIVDEDAKVLGFVSDGDILKYLSNQSGSYFTDGTNFYSLVDQEDFWGKLGGLLELQALRIATRRVISIDAHADVEDAFKTLSEKRIKKIPVLLEGRLVGTLSRSNIITALEQAEFMLNETNRQQEAS